MYLIGDRVIVNYTDGKPVIGVVKKIKMNKVDVQLDTGLMLVNLPILSLRRA